MIPMRVVAMAWNNDEEKTALKRKLEDKNAFVTCPTCGGEITYERRGNSIYVKCQGSGISGGVRGI